MNKIIYSSALFVLTTILIVSCAPTVKVVTDYDRSVNFASFKTFSIYDCRGSYNVSDLNAQRVRNSVRNEMIKKGYIENEADPDLLINVVTLLKDKKYLSATNDGWYGPFGYWSGPNTTVRAYDYKDGFLLIHLLNTKTNKLVWEGEGNAEITKQPKDPDEAIQNAVSKIMQSFPQRNIN